MRDSHNNTGFSTRAIHYGYDPLSHGGALVPPVYQTATFAFPTVEYGAACFAGEEGGHFYSRISNPTLALLEQRMASLEGGEAGLALASGMGAITSTLWTLLRPGDELIVGRTLYGCTFAYLHHGIGEFGVKIQHVDLNDPQALKAAITAKTRMIYFETPANPNMQLVDIAAVAEAVRGHDISIVVDNTYCTLICSALWNWAPTWWCTRRPSTVRPRRHHRRPGGRAQGAGRPHSPARAQGHDRRGAVAHDASLLMRHEDPGPAPGPPLRQCPAVGRAPCPPAAGRADPLPRAAVVPAVRIGATADAPAGWDDRLRAQGWHRGRAPLHECIAAVQPGGEPGRRRVAGPAPGEHDPLQLHARGAGAPWYFEGLVRLSVGLEDIDDLLADIDQALKACA
jgi:methionine-gamma-lyase